LAPGFTEPAVNMIIPFISSNVTSLAVLGIVVRVPTVVRVLGIVVGVPTVVRVLGIVGNVLVTGGRVTGGGQW